MQFAESSSSDRVRLWLERSRSGYVLRDAATYEAVRENDPRIRVVNVAGVSFRIDELQADAFAPGRRLALVAEPDNEHDPNAIAVWDAERRSPAANPLRIMSGVFWVGQHVRNMNEPPLNAGSPDHTASIHSYWIRLNEFIILRCNPVACSRAVDVATRQKNKAISGVAKPCRRLD